MQTMEMHMLELVESNMISKETAIEKTGNQNMFDEVGGRK
jgi:Tfp pilus assembly pilus retraction ATPase PilT